MILNVWLCWMSLEGARLLELNGSVSVASGMPHYEHNQTAVSYSSQFLTKQSRYKCGGCSACHIPIMPDDAVQSSMSEQYWRHVYS